MRNGDKVRDDDDEDDEDDEERYNDFMLKGEDPKAESYIRSRLIILSFHLCLFLNR